MGDVINISTPTNTLVMDQVETPDWKLTLEQLLGRHSGTYIVTYWDKKLWPLNDQLFGEMHREVTRHSDMVEAIYQFEYMVANLENRQGN